MGNDESLPENPYFPSEIDPFKNEDHQQRNYIQSLPTNFTHPFTPLIEEEEIKTPTNIYRPAFGGTWSVKLPESISPICRKGHFCTYSSILKKLYIGYGVEDTDQPKFLNDVWQFDIHARKWEHLNLKYQGNNNDNNLLKQITQRKYSTATISEKDMKLYIFGGVNENREYISNFHSIDLRTGQVTLIIPSSQQNIESYSTVTETYSSASPKARKGAIIQYYNGQIYLWGGIASGANILNEISVYDISSNTWATKIFVRPKRIKSNSHVDLANASNSNEPVPSSEYWVEGRANLPWQLVDNHIYAYGGSPQKTLIDIEISPTSPSQNPAFESVKSITIREIECIGSAPPENTFYSGMVYINSPFNVKQYQFSNTNNNINIQINPINNANSNSNTNPNNLNNATPNSTPTNPTPTATNNNINYISGRHGLLVYLGGRSYSKYTLIYGLDLSRFWWFVLHVAPDGDTVTYSDGKISENGLFMTPRFYNFALGYDEAAREVVACAAHQGLISKAKARASAHKKRRVTDINAAAAQGEGHELTRRFSNIVVSDEVNTYLIANYAQNKGASGDSSLNRNRPNIPSISNQPNMASNNSNRPDISSISNQPNNNSNNRLNIPSMSRQPNMASNSRRRSGGNLGVADGGSGSNLSLGSAFDSSSNYYDAKGAQQAGSRLGGGMGQLAAGEKLFVYRIGDVLAGLGIKEDLLTMQKMAALECEAERGMDDDDGEVKIVDF